MHRSWNACISVLALWLVIGVAYAPLWRAEFINYDDPTCVTLNPGVTGGLSWTGVRWACTTFHFSNWIPLTWMSLQWDVHWWGPDPRGFHLTNLLLHLGGVGLVWLIVRRLTSDAWAPTLVAGLYGLHPLHVESVAWIAERKGILSTFFGLAAVWAYLRHHEQRTWLRWTFCTGLWLCSLCSKQMFVTFPIVMLLVDYWPLGRWRPGADRWRCVVEKLPWFGISVVFGVIAVSAQMQHHSVRSDALFHWPDRMRIASVNVVEYLRRFVWPADLCVCYPPPKSAPALTTALACVGVIMLISLSVWRQRGRAPAMFVGWFWFLIVLAPVSGLVQVGSQVIADRYSDLPLLGLEAIVVAVLLRWRLRDRWPMGVGLLTAAIIVAGWQCHRQVRTWQNSGTLFHHAIRVASPNSRAHIGLGVYDQTQGRLAEARREYDQALSIDPNDGLAHQNLANLLMDLHRIDEAVAAYRKAVQFQPHQAAPHANLGRALLLQNKLPEAVTALERAVQLDPTSVTAVHNLGGVYVHLGDHRQAERCFRQVLQLDPTNAKAWSNLGVLADARRQHDEALVCYERALTLEPNNPSFLLRRAEAHWQLGHRPIAIAGARQALQLAEVTNNRPAAAEIRQALDRWTAAP